MNSPIENTRAADAARQAEETLRIIASLPAPQWLEDRITEALSKAPRTGRMLAWPLPRERWMHSALVRGAAAAAIVCVVGAGGWGVYSHVHPNQAPKAVAMPPHVAAPGGFSSAGAMRTPQTLNRPVLIHPVTTTPQQAPNLAQKRIRKTQKTVKRAEAAKTR